MMLVTGANGFVGTGLCNELQRRALSFRAASRTPVGSASTHIRIGTVDANTDWSEALRGCDTVIHLAAVAHKPMGDDALAELQAVNVDGVRTLAQQAVDLGVRRFVFLSSIKAWGETTAAGQRARETDVAQPQDAYGRSKFAAEQALHALHGAMETIVVRAPLVYGPGVKANFAALCNAVLRGWPLPLGCVTGNARSLIALDNLIDFLLLCARHPAAGGQTFHVSDGADLSTTELVRAIARAGGISARLLPIPTRLLRVALILAGKGPAADSLLGNLQIDMSKARRLLQWQPPLNLDEGMRRVLATRGAV